MVVYSIMGSGRELILSHKLYIVNKIINILNNIYRRKYDVNVMMTIIN